MTKLFTFLKEYTGITKILFWLGLIVAINGVYATITSPSHTSIFPNGDGSLIFYIFVNLFTYSSHCLMIFGGLFGLLSEKTSFNIIYRDSKSKISSGFIIVIISLYLYPLFNILLDWISIFFCIEYEDVFIGSLLSIITIPFVFMASAIIIALSTFTWSTIKELYLYFLVCTKDIRRDIKVILKRFGIRIFFKK